MSDRTDPPPVPSLADVEHGLEMSLREAMETQRAIRRLRPDPVDDAIVLRCLDLATRAPTGGNAQNWEYVVVKDRERVAALGREYARAWRVYGTAAGIVAGRRDDGGSSRRIVDAVEWQVAHFAEVPVVVVVCLRNGRLPVLPMPPVAASSFYGSAYPSVQNLLLAARAMGLGASLTTLPLWSITAARLTIGLPLSVTPVCVVPMGWPEGRYGPTTRRPVGQVVHLDRFGNRPWADS